MTFEVRPDDEHPEIRNEGMQYEGLRFRTECRLAGKIYGRRFGTAVAFGDPIFGDAEVVTARDTLGFAGIEPPTLRLYPVETHIAEKLHAYTMPRSRPNSRVKDLPDLALLALTKELDAGQLRAALDGTFAFRATHPVPGAVPAPPESWGTPYAAMARENGLAWETLEDVTNAVRRFLDPVLVDLSGHEARWDASSWEWCERGASHSDV